MLVNRYKLLYHCLYCIINRNGSFKKQKQKHPFVNIRPAMHTGSCSKLFHIPDGQLSLQLLPFFLPFSLFYPVSVQPVFLSRRKKKSLFLMLHIPRTISRVLTLYFLLSLFDPFCIFRFLLRYIWMKEWGECVCNRNVLGIASWNCLNISNV